MEKRGEILTRQIRMSWNRFDSAARKLARQIKKSGIKFRGVYGIKRGGLILAVRLSHLLDIPFLDGGIMDETVLIVDDISDTGNVLDSITLLNKTKTACIYSTAWTTHVPDFYIYEKPKNSWVVFPWEKK
jgi:hypoxanthine phosphoribosyltransferase